MPGQLFNLGRYIKKKKSKDEPTTAGKPAQSDAQAPVVEEKTSVTTSTSVVPPPNQAPSQPSQSPPASGDQNDQKDEEKEKNNQTVGKQPSPPSEEQQKKAADQTRSSIDTGKRTGMDVLTRLTQRSHACLMTAVKKAKELKVQYIDTEHVLLGLLSDSGVYELISDFKVTPKEIQDFLEKSFKKGNFSGRPQFSPRVKRVLELSLSAARALGYEFISPEHILLSLAQEGEGMASQVLAKYGLTVEKLNKKITGKAKLEKEEKKGKSPLEEFCTDLTQQARDGKLDPVVERSSEIERAIHILARRTKNNPCLIGDAGVGKTAIVEGLAQRIVAGDVPEPLLNKKILQLDLMSLIAGAKHRGDFESRLKNLIKEVKASSGAIILFIDELHNMVGAGAGGERAMDASNILKPSLARGELQTIGTDTIAEYRRYIEKDPALERRFQPIMVPEPTVEAAMNMLRVLRDKYEAFHKVSIPEDAVEAAVRLSSRYIGDRFLPDKAVDLIDEAGSAVRIPSISLPEEIKNLQKKIKRLEEEKKQAEKIGDQVKLELTEKKIKERQEKLEEAKKSHDLKKSTTTNVVTPEIIAEIVSRWTKIPISKLTEKESQKLLKMEDLMHQQIIDQEEAVGAIAEAVRRGRAGLTSQKRPIGSFIFMGPTGVGKTELAKVLAEILFGSREMTVRMDMTEYMEKHEVAKLIGAPPGYVGYEEGGQLTEAVRRRPYSVVLLDEIEKAHPDVFNILIQLLDDGRLTDNKGRTISFKNTIVICTSNIGTGLIQKQMLEVGKLQFAAPAFSTYAVTPTGREIITLKERYWLKQEKEKNDWEVSSLKKYFEGQKVENADPFDKAAKLPENGFATQVVLPSGEEMITSGGRMWKRKSTTAKGWETVSLIDYFKDNAVINALPDRPEEQLPTARVASHAVSPQEVEMITLGSRYWKRKGLKTKDWETGMLSDYLKDGVVVGETNADQGNTDKTDTPDKSDVPDVPEKSDSIQPEPASGRVAAGKPEEPDVVKPAVANNTDNTDKTEKKDADITDKESQNTQKKNENTEKEEGVEDLVSATSGDSVSPAIAEKPANVLSDTELQLPTEKWDIHLFTPDGKELIIVGGRVWFRNKVGDKEWQTQPLSQYFSNAKVKNALPNNFDDQLPVGQEIEKQKEKAKSVEDEKFAEMAEKLLEELRKFFKPEILNRFDEIMVFRPLMGEHMVKIVDLQMKSVVKLLEEQNIGLTWTKPAAQQLATLGYDPMYGARPLRRTIQRMIENPISSHMIKGEIKTGDMISVDFDGNDFVFEVKKYQTKNTDGTDKEVIDQTEKKDTDVTDGEKTDIPSKSDVPDKPETPKTPPPLGSVSPEPASGRTTADKPEPAEPSTVSPVEPPPGAMPLGQTLPDEKSDLPSLESEGKDQASAQAAG